MFYIFQFNFLPDRTTYKFATDLLLKQYRSKIPADALDHVLNHYLDGEKPELLGGRAVGRQGMCGSTNSLERYGGHVKNTFGALAAERSTEALQNPILILEAAATHLSDVATPARGFKCSPLRTVANFDVIRKLSKWRRSGQNNDSVFSDFAFAQCTRDGIRTNLRDVIGKGDSYRVHFPTCKTTYEEAKQMKLEDVASEEFGFFHEQNLSSHHQKASRDYTTTDRKRWRQFVGEFSEAERITLYRRLAAHFDRHTIEPWEGEDIRSYLARHAQRLLAGEKAKGALPKKKKRGRRKKKGKSASPPVLLTLDEKREIQEEKDKWAPNEGELMVDLGEEPTMEAIADHLDLIFGWTRAKCKLSKCNGSTRESTCRGSWEHGPRLQLIPQTRRSHAIAKIATRGGGVSGSIPSSRSSLDWYRRSR